MLKILLAQSDQAYACVCNIAQAFKQIKRRRALGYPQTRKKCMSKSYPIQRLEFPCSLISVNAAHKDRSCCLLYSQYFQGLNFPSMNANFVLQKLFAGFFSQHEN